MTKVIDIVTVLRQYFPEEIASSGDPVGIQIGSLNQTVTGLMTTLDVRPQVVDEAIDKGINFIISHHPVMFHPAVNLNFANPQNEMYAKIIKHGITIYSIHTNSDKAQDGSSDWQAEELGLKEIEPFCLDDDGIAIGRKGKLAHSFSAHDFAYYVKYKMKINMVRLITAEPTKMISTVGFICGDGSKYWHQAVKEKLDAFITGDVYYHTGHDMISSGLTVVDPGHYTEKLFKDKMYEKLNQWNDENNWNIQIDKSVVSTNPFQDLF
ncbi:MULTISPECIES: Nif3-like dinuclear metal center hexameric protein [unclassified Lactobacillus]|uniref:Nif3-like dinuclear metal center hexameric protein n=1 Tax=unclassified Lactobacillus TaxID=2620435 RepID=UPI000EFC4B28|nr:MULTISPECIES: Nif3-like dinuclear metal center hexameric protein [unclassified Lactobacillus]RMC24338.1 Nif3-like dinuclear metal center hexameric protein [Lactobacillus sp. ESL0247]RMC28477.1 Nif3-like dinuclear metal center hexameric protein [Lactobacillus sp. ESL0246]RMC31668.1 Nif3-like dinuclear metal center hexameric protein [Lactobacillus sp. ESL0245]RMC48820.1 Nif3-like dinuclear metal center hexameric protein [Lactobacillus sp. ESL0228]